MKCSQCRKLTKELDSVWDRVRLWCFHWFHKDIIDLVQEKFTQGFSDGYEAGFKQCKERTDETINFYKAQIKQQEQNPTLATVEHMHVLTSDNNGYLYLKGEKVTEGEQQMLEREASYIKETRLWKIFQETLRYHAYDAMFERSQSFDDMKTGKLMLYNLDVIRKIVENLAK